MRIRDHIKTAALDLISRQEALGLPPELADRARAAWEGDSWKIRGDAALLNLEFSAREIRKGRGGKQYVRYTTSEGVVCYFPNARFGRFISREVKTVNPDRTDREKAWATAAYDSRRFR